MKKLWFEKNNETQKFYSNNSTAIIQQEENGYISFCPELDIASQGDTIPEAKMNLSEE